MNRFICSQPALIENERLTSPLFLKSRSDALPRNFAVTYIKVYAIVLLDCSSDVGDLNGGLESGSCPWVT